MSKNLRQKRKYLENENRNALKSIFHHFQRACIEVNNFLEGKSPTSLIQLKMHNLKSTPDTLIHEIFHFASNIKFCPLF